MAVVGDRRPCVHSVHSGLLGRSSPNFDKCSIVTRNYKIGSEIGQPPPQNWRSKYIKILVTFRTISQLDREYLRNQTEYNVERKTLTAIRLAHVYLIWWTLVRKQWKIGPEFRPTQCARFTYSVSQKKSPPWNFLIFSPNGWEFLVQILHAYYTFLSTLDYKFYSIILNFDEVMPY